MRTALAVMLILGVIGGGVLLTSAEAWSQGFDIGKGNRMKWFLLFLVGALLIIVCGGALFIGANGK